MGTIPRWQGEAPALVERLLGEAWSARASDVHVEPMAGAYELRLRVDGLLRAIGGCDVPTGRSVVARLMVMAHLLTYRADVPQEGRLQWTHSDGSAELRLAVMPSIHGLRAAVRLPAELVQPRKLSALGLPGHVMAGLERFARADGGMLLLTGPAGSGKTRTIFALLEHISSTSRHRPYRRLARRSIIHPDLAIRSTQRPVAGRAGASGLSAAGGAHDPAALSAKSLSMAALRVA